MGTTARLTIPMDKTLCDKLHKQAGALGFDSPQALLRYVSKTLVDGRHITFGRPVDDWGPVPKHVAERWLAEDADLDRELKTGEAKSFDNVEDFLADLRGHGQENHPDQKLSKGVSKKSRPKRQP